MADNGVRVLVLERERQFSDRVRGEVIWPWGVAEIKELGLFELLSSCDRKMAKIALQIADAGPIERDLESTTPQGTSALNWVHHEMEEVLLQAAENAGAEVRRGVRACGLNPGAPPTVVADYNGHLEELHSRLVVCADGRSSVARKWGDFQVRQDSYGCLIGGVLFEAMPKVASDASHWIINPSRGQFAFLTPQNGGRMRAYAFHPREMNYRWQGQEDLPRFVEDSVKAGAMAEWFAGAKAIGPLATFDGADSWVDHPYKNGIALIGDAAASSDPSYGQGQGLTVRDVRVLRDHLLTNTDWESAGHAYAEEHDRYYGALHEGTSWIYQLIYAYGPEADRRRLRALPLLLQDMTRLPDVLFSGPEVPLGEAVRRRLFAEEA
jgi:2-polyprenyl-6-methoxyphenol hydroxylase-like FAD-dependent oxidoreductase